MYFDGSLKLDGGGAGVLFISPKLASGLPLLVGVEPSPTKVGPPVAKMASHAIFQYNVLAIDDTHNT